MINSIFKGTSCVDLLTTVCDKVCYSLPDCRDISITSYSPILNTFKRCSNVFLSQEFGRDFFLYMITMILQRIHVLICILNE